MLITYITNPELLLLIYLLATPDPVFTCDETSCNLGTSIGNALCGAGAAVIGTAICSGTSWSTFGLSCLLPIAGATICAIGSDLIKEQVCPLCEGEFVEAPDFDLVVGKTVAIKNELRNIDFQLGVNFTEVKDNIIKSRLNKERWFRNLRAVQKDTISAETKLISDVSVGQFDVSNARREIIKGKLKKEEWFSKFNGKIQNIERK